MKTLLELCGSWFYKEINKMISGDEAMKRIFDAS
jgi:hypothetical protein